MYWNYNSQTSEEWKSMDNMEIQCYICSCIYTLICNYWAFKLFSVEMARSQRPPGRVGACLAVLIPSGNGSTTMRQHRHWNMSSFTPCFNFKHVEWKPVYCSGVRKWALAEAEVRFNESNCLEYVQQCMMCFILIPTRSKSPFSSLTSNSYSPSHTFQVFCIMTITAQFSS